MEGWYNMTTRTAPRRLTVSGTSWTLLPGGTLETAEWVRGDDSVIVRIREVFPDDPEKRAVGMYCANLVLRNGSKAALSIVTREHRTMLAALRDLSGMVVFRSKGQRRAVVEWPR